MTILQVLGCSGSIGGPRRTTSFLVDQHTLIDVGTGALDLSLEQLTQIDHIFLTHSHLDHILGLALIMDATHKLRHKPIEVLGLASTLQTLQEDIFNDRIWPNLNNMRHAGRELIQWHAIDVFEKIPMPGCDIEALPAQHTVPALGYAVHGPQASWVFSGDTQACGAFWQHLKNLPQLRDLVIETSFDNSQETLAHLSQHFTPEQVTHHWQAYAPQTQLWISHLKASYEPLIENNYQHTQHTIQFLQQGQTFSV